MNKFTASTLRSEKRDIKSTSCKYFLGKLKLDWGGPINPCTKQSIGIIMFFKESAHD